MFRYQASVVANPDGTKNRPVASLTVPDDGVVIHMKKHGFIKLFHSVNKQAKTVTGQQNCLTMDDTDRKNLQAIG
ncbi:MAG TPA: hypothetical protein PKK74_05090 [Candidatus Methanoculleus thermohydrogenotrophicum]|jgi:hypothetical protein|nr:hypothetical protein [Candidatus Methanoculleus thermohydrogenotrophicum]NLM82151.1 hypothetical protein [Candidatus Methanoculleus thermohydrogenotrophicum]HOB18052.1 hypothetical protein [Candidatus Methanoculleus thermohydrogenotrophicum]HPZ38160.1 hypothetical protein [Candidatus Methanoculleus thermohydrogenotrophicum]HQC91374.1 hypothetical protein [Candidatus Methanoculleus thermohydrogenotrophicum]